MVIKNKRKPVKVVVKNGYGKRWIFISVVSSLFLAWYFMDKKVLPVEIAKVSELVFESAIFQSLPIPKIFNEDIHSLYSI